MNKFFQKKFEIPSLIIIIIVISFIALLGSTFSNYINASNPIVMLPGAAGVEGQGPDTPITWNLVYMDYDNGDNPFRVWSCAHPDDNFYADWEIDGTFEGLLKDCMEHVHSFYP